jgi:hypothetical protein
VCARTCAPTYGFADVQSYAVDFEHCIGEKIRRLREIEPWTQAYASCLLNFDVRLDNNSVVLYVTLLFVE